MSEYTEEEKREAFAAWEEYKPRFAETIAGFVRVPGAGQTLLDNPLVMLIYADAYLAGKRAAIDRRALATAELLAVVRAVAAWEEGTGRADLLEALEDYDRALAGANGGEGEGGA